MSSQSKRKSVCTGVMEDNYEYTWQIQNFLKVPKQGKLLDYQKFQIKTGSNKPLQSKWVVGLKNSADEKGVQYYHVYCKLKDILPVTEINELNCSVTVEPTKVDGSALWTETLEGKLKVNSSLEVTRPHWWNNTTDLTGVLDESGSLNIYVKLSLIQPVSENFDGSSICTSFYEELFQMKSANIARRNFARLLADLTEFDVKIVCHDEREFNCHRSVLKSYSSVFESMFKPGLSGAKTGVIKVDDISGKTMDVILQYMYTGELQPVWRAPDVITEFTYAVGRYRIKKLVEFLDNVIGRVTTSSANSREELNFANKMCLKKDEKRLHEAIAQLTLSVPYCRDFP